MDPTGSANEDARIFSSECNDAKQGKRLRCEMSYHGAGDIRRFKTRLAIAVPREETLSERIFPTPHTQLSFQHGFKGAVLRTLCIQTQ